MGFGPQTYVVAFVWRRWAACARRSARPTCACQCFPLCQSLGERTAHSQLVNAASCTRTGEVSPSRAPAGSRTTLPCAACAKSSAHNGGTVNKRQSAVLNDLCPTQCPDAEVVCPVTERRNAQLRSRLEPAEITTERRS